MVQMFLKYLLHLGHRAGAEPTVAKSVVRALRHGAGGWRALGEAMGH